MMWFPKYMKLFYEAQLLIMDNNEFGREDYDNDAETALFPAHVNYYIAIQAVSCYKCEYLMYILQEQFLLSGGPLEWLIYGLERVDPKVRRIAEINEIMAFKPWSLTQEIIESLLKGPDSNENLTIQELVKASLILSTYHSMCTLCQGMGLTCDDDIQEEMLSLIGPEALQLTVIPRERKLRRSVTGTSDTGAEADVSSVNNSLQSGTLEPHARRALDKLRKTAQRKK
jgi:hypothetical protein